MKISGFTNTAAGQMIIMTALGIAVIYIVEQKAKQVASDLGQAVNPLNSDNIFNSGVNNVIQQLTDGKNKTLGGWIYDKLHQNSDNAPGAIGVWNGLPSK